jgi:F-type H+-transporting ATPase subunit b
MMRLRAGSVLLLAAMCVPAALAAEEGGDPVHSTTGLIYRWINSGIVVGALVWLIRKGRGWFRGRAEAIASSINLAAKTKAEAEQQLRDAEDRLAHLEQEAAALRAAAQREAAAETERIRATAREESAKIERAADAEIEAARRAAHNALKALAARLSVERAEAQIRRQMTAETQAAVFRRFVEELAGGAH